MQIVKKLLRRPFFGFMLVACLAAPFLLAFSTKSSSVAMSDDGIVLGQIRQLSDSPPLYEMRYTAPYDVIGPVTSVPRALTTEGPSFGCTTFSATDASGHRVMGRNFDWVAHPILVLFTKPKDGYASISIADMSYTWRLIDAPRWPFDGMNERGLAVAMMIVDEAQSACEPGMASLSSFEIIRVILDKAATVDEALALMGKYFVTFGNRPLHYFIADRSGASAVAEYYRGKLTVTRSARPWQVSTNFVFAKWPERAWPALCWRYFTAVSQLSKSNGRLDSTGVYGLLQSVSQDNTVWSASYDLTTTKVTLALEKKFDKTFSWSLTE